MVCMNTLHSVVTAALMGLCVCLSSSGFICSVFPLQMEVLQAQEPVIGLLSLSQWAVVNLKPADSWADIGRLSMNNCTARATLSLSVWKNRQGFTSYSADNADDDYYHKLVTVLQWKTPGVCFCPNVQPILPFVCQERYFGNNIVTWLVSYFCAYFSPSTLLASASQLIYSCTKPLIHNVFCNTQWTQMH